MAAHVTMHHPKLKVERAMPEAAVKHWQRSGWKVGELPKVKSKTDMSDDNEQKGSA